MKNRINNATRFLFVSVFSIFLCMGQALLGASTTGTKTLSWSDVPAGSVDPAKVAWSVEKDCQVIFNGKFGTCTNEDGSAPDGSKTSAVSIWNSSEDSKYKSWTYFPNYSNTKGPSDPVYIKAGTYYIHCFCLGYSGSLNLEITYTTGDYSADVTPNNTKALAQEFSLTEGVMGTIGFKGNQKEVYEGDEDEYWIGDQKDYFKFEINKSGKLSLELLTSTADTSGSTGMALIREAGDTDVSMGSGSIWHGSDTQTKTIGPYDIKADTTYYVYVSGGPSSYKILPTFKADETSNTDPSAISDTASTTIGTAVTIDVLTNDTDADGDTISIESVGNASNGTTSISSGKIIYTPTSTFTGTDSFSYIISDGNGGTSSATVTVTVSTTASNTAPVASDGTATTSKDTATSITLNASDADGDSLTYTVVSNPSQGTLTGTAPNLTYTPTSGYTGSDSFTFKANDGTDDSNTATISITITSGSSSNTAPIASDYSLSVKTDTATSVTLSATDADGDSLTYTVVSNPSNGTLTGTAPNLTYTPTSAYTGSDSFTFKANDGTDDSNTATISITVSGSGGNNAPTASNATISAEVNTDANITLSASDPDGDSMTYTVVSNPSNGTLSGTAPNLVYTPTTDYSGSDSFTFKANDGTADSNTATVSITVSDSGGGGVSDTVILIYNYSSKAITDAGKKKETYYILVEYDTSAETYGSVSVIIYDKKAKSYDAATSSDLKFTDNSTMVFASLFSNNIYSLLLNGLIKATDVGIGKDNKIDIAPKFVGVGCYYSSTSNWGMQQKVKMSLNKKFTKESNTNQDDLSAAADRVEKYLSDKGFN